MGNTERWLEEPGLTSIPGLLGGAALQRGDGGEREVRRGEMRRGEREESCVPGVWFGRVGRARRRVASSRV